MSEAETVGALIAFVLSVSIATAWAQVERTPAGTLRWRTNPKDALATLIPTILATGVAVLFTLSTDVVSRTKLAVHVYEARPVGGPNYGSPSIAIDVVYRNMGNTYVRVSDFFVQLEFRANDYWQLADSSGTRGQIQRCLHANVVKENVGGISKGPGNWDTVYIQLTPKAGFTSRIMSPGEVAQEEGVYGLTVTSLFDELGWQNVPARLAIQFVVTGVDGEPFLVRKTIGVLEWTGEKLTARRPNSRPLIIDPFADGERFADSEKQRVFSWVRALQRGPGAVQFGDDDSAFLIVVESDTTLTGWGFVEAN